MLTIKSREGDDLKVRLTDNFAVIGIAKAEMSEIKPGSYIGVSAMPEPDGTQRALAVHIFPEAQRGAAEGFRPWDLRPNSTMTNATVARHGRRHRRPEHPGQIQGWREESRGAAGHADRRLRQTAEKSELKPGAKIIIFGAAKKDDGTLETGRIGVGLDGITPPM